MCYRKPGPRCTSHAQERLASAEKSLSSNPSTLRYAAVRRARDEYDMTPGGLRELQDKMDAAKNEADREMYLNRFRRGRDMRNAALEEIKAIDSGDIGEHQSTIDSQREQPKVLVTLQQASSVLDLTRSLYLHQGYGDIPHHALKKLLTVDRESLVASGHVKKDETVKSAFKRTLSRYYGSSTMAESVTDRVFNQLT